MPKNFEIGQGVPEIWEFKGLEMILLRETKKRKKYHCADFNVISAAVLWASADYTNA